MRLFYPDSSPSGGRAFVSPLRRQDSDLNLRLQRPPCCQLHHAGIASGYGRINDACPPPRDLAVQVRTTSDPDYKTAVVRVAIVLATGIGVRLLERRPMEALDGHTCDSGPKRACRELVGGGM